MNPALIMKMMEAKSKFDSAHPKFARFIGDVFRNGVEEGSVIEINISKPDGSTMSTNMRVTESDLELIGMLKEMRP